MVSGKKVKLLRINNGWSQEHLSDVSGLGLRTIQRIEKEGNCSLESKIALCSAFSVSPNGLTSNIEWEKPLKKGINWDGIVGLSISLFIVIVLLALSGNIYFYLDPWSFLLVTLLPFGLSCISSGVKNSVRVFSNISWLFLLPSNIKALPHLIPCIRRIIYYAYMAGIFGTVISTIAIFSNLTPDSPDFWPSLAISFISLLYALIFAELILRPLKHKYEQILSFSNNQNME